MTNETFSSLLDRARNSVEYRTGVRLKRRRFPRNENELTSSDLFKSWWYYSIELLPGFITKGVYAADLPMLPRLMLRKCDLTGMSCLDMGSMEGLIPVLMRRGGAEKVLAIDAVSHCREKQEAVKHYYGVDFEYKNVGLMYDLRRKLDGRGFDLINCSGLLYHVFSPLMVLCGIRPLLKRNGLMIVSTNAIAEDGYAMEFNNAGRMQTEGNTFWYLSVKLFDYLLRYLRLAPVDSLFVPYTAMRYGTGYVFDKRSGYLSVLCRATDTVLPVGDDEWMAGSVRESWEYQWNADWRLAARQPVSAIKCRDSLDKRFFRRDLDCLDLWEAVQNAPIASAAGESDSHILRLSDKF